MLAPAALVWLWRARRAEAQLILAVSAAVVLAAAQLADWHGDPTWGPRRALPAVPFALEAVALAWSARAARRRDSRRASALLALLVAAGIGVQTVGIAIAPATYFRVVTDVRAGHGRARLVRRRAVGVPLHPAVLAHPRARLAALAPRAQRSPVRAQSAVPVAAVEPAQAARRVAAPRTSTGSRSAGRAGAGGGVAGRARRRRRGGGVDVAPPSHATVTAMADWAILGCGYVGTRLARALAAEGGHRVRVPARATARASSRCAASASRSTPWTAPSRARSARRCTG